MEEVDKDPQESPEPSVSEHQEADKGVSAEGPEEDTGADEEFSEESQSEEEEEEEEESEQFTTSQRIINLQRDLTTLVTNIQTAADAKESMRRKELEEARRTRLERLENDIKSSQEKFEEISRGWSMAKEKVVPQELQQALNSQQQLCAELIEDKKKLINDLQQELKVGDDRYVKDLRKQAEELDVMMERMEEQIKTLTQAYREELTQIESVYQQEREVLLTRHKIDWEQYTKELTDNQQMRIAEKYEKVEDFEVKIHNRMLENTDKFCITKFEQAEKSQVLEREHQQMKTSRMIINLKQKKEENEKDGHNMQLSHTKSRIVSLQSKVKDLTTVYARQEKQFKQKHWYLSEEYKRKIHQYERIQKKIRHFAVADARKFEEMWLMIEAEVKQLVEQALVFDSMICKQHLCLAWERPAMAFMELTGPLKPQKQSRSPTHQTFSQLFQTGQAAQCSKGMIDASVGPRLETDAESTGMEVCREGTAVESGRAAKEEGMVSVETMKKLMELLCDESGFLMEDKLLKLLASLKMDEQTVVKLDSLLCAFGIDEADMPKLADFLLKHQQQQRKSAEDVFAELGESINSTTNLTSKSIHANYVLPAFKSFLKQHMHYRESLAHPQPSFQFLDVRDTSKDEAYWESMGNIISEDKVSLWEAAENTLKQHLSVLTDISELITETQSLKQQNTELRMLLQQSLTSRVCV
ncbi:dynein regulatory complex protein 1 [Scomber scombrus]|uniref:Dynein regulatory complex protein 1 n=1 Tax=Scomber scombrus TaxID=13677 RepID=A0AAV1NSA1_SCOSC